MSKSDLSSLFYPKSVAIAGVSTGDKWNVGQAFLQSLLQYGFPGKIYPLNPKGGKVFGLKVYSSIREVDGLVDYVVSCIGAASLPQLIEDCIAKGVKAISIYTAGFSEAGSLEGNEQEKELCRLAQAGGLRLIGPNCLGVYCPQSALSFGPDLPRESGHVALISQSGGNADYLVRGAAQRGIRFSKVVSMGNGADVSASELLDYFITDPETEIVAAYIEGVKDGGHFHHVLKELARIKPVVILKGGRSSIGARVAASHTGSLAGSDEVWDRLLQQAGTIRVDSLAELIDMLVTLVYMPLLQGRRLALFGIGGGSSVLAVDECTNAGFTFPVLPQDIQNDLEGFIGSKVGVMVNNPVDLAAEGTGDIPYHVFSRMSSYEGIDLMIAQVPLSPVLYPLLDLEVDAVLRVHSELNKPMAIILDAFTWNWQKGSEYQQKCYQAGIPVYHSIGGAAKAISRFLDYHQKRLR